MIIDVSSAVAIPTIFLGGRRILFKDRGKMAVARLQRLIEALLRLTRLHIPDLQVESRI